MDRLCRGVDPSSLELGGSDKVGLEHLPDLLLGVEDRLGHAVCGSVTAYGEVGPSRLTLVLLSLKVDTFTGLAALGRGDKFDSTGVFAVLRGRAEDHTLGGDPSHLDRLQAECQ